MREWRKLKRKEAATSAATLEIIGSAHTYYPIREIDSETGDDEVEAADTPIQPPHLSSSIVEIPISIDVDFTFNHGLS